MERPQRLEVMLAGAAIPYPFSHILECLRSVAVQLQQIKTRSNCFDYEELDQLHRFDRILTEWVTWVKKKKIKRTKLLDGVDHKMNWNSNTVSYG